MDTIAIAGLLLSVLAGKQYFLHKASFHLYMMLTFLVFSSGCGYIGYSMSIGRPEQIAHTWAILTILIGLLLTPVFYKHFFALVGDRGGICLEGGFLGMVMGLMFITTPTHWVLPLLGMVCLASFYFGYARIQQLLRR
jgi:hypothetical protein